MSAFPLEIRDYLERQDAAGRARFLAILGLDLSVLARISAMSGNATVSQLKAFNEMQHCIYGHLAPILHGDHDAFFTETFLELLCHYAGETGCREQVEQSLARARSLAGNC